MQSFLGDFQNKLISLEDRCKHICKYENKRWQSEMRQVLPQQVITTLRQHRTVVKRKKTKPNNTRLAENVNTWSLLISVRYISFFIFCRLDHAIIGRNGSRGQRNGEAQRKQCRASFFTLRTALQFYNLHWPWWWSSGQRACLLPTIWVQIPQTSTVFKQNLCLKRTKINKK